MFVLQRAKRLGLVSLVAFTAAAVSVIDSAGLEIASAQPVVTLYASPGGRSTDCASVADACDLTQALAEATAPGNKDKAVVVVAGPGTYYESSIAIDARSLASLSITGAGASATTVRPGMVGAFLISGGAVTLSGLSINGSRESAIAVRTSEASPGADVIITDDSFSGDEGVNGGAVEGDSSSSISVTGDTFADDESSFGDGGALFSQGAVVATDDTFSGDQAGLYGGAIFAGGALVAADDTFVDNAAASGGAITTDAIGPRQPTASIAGQRHLFRRHGDGVPR